MSELTKLRKEYARRLQNLLTADYGLIKFEYTGPFYEAALDYIYALELALSDKTAEVDQLRVQLVDSNRERAASTADNGDFSAIKDLADPNARLTPRRVHINREPEARLQASCCNSREEFSGPSVKGTKFRHSDRTFHPDYLIGLLREIESEMIRGIAAEGSVLKERLPDHRLISAWTECQADMVFKVIHEIERALKR